MTGPSYVQKMSGFKVTEEIKGAHPINTSYPLLPGDFLVEQEDGTFYKVAPGIGMVGFVLTEEQKSRLGRYEDEHVGIGGTSFFFGGES